MFREMRRNKQQISEDECLAVLGRGTSGVLALHGDGGYPYAVPLSYVSSGGRIYFHCAREGHKMDALKACDKASFCVIGKDEVIPARYATDYESVIAFGRVRALTGDEAARAIEMLAVKYAPGDEAGRRREIAGAAGRYTMLELTVEHMTGKRALL